MGPKISVVVVDDEPAVGDLAATHLERIHDMDVAVETTAEAGLERRERNPETIDCIVSEYVLPGMDGLDFLSAVRAVDSDVPFILFTGTGSEEVASEAISAGVTDYLQKGTGKEQYERLGNPIKNAVETYRAERRTDEPARISGVQREPHGQSSREDLETTGDTNLIESERKYRSLLDAAPDAVFIADADTGMIVETNAAAEELLGLPRREILGMHQSDLHPTEDADRYRELFEEGLATGMSSAARFPDGSEIFAVRADGERVPVEINAEIVELGDRTLVHGRFRDITEERARERELREERALAESLFDATPDPIYALDSDGRMFRWNDTFASVVGYSSDEIMGMHCLEFVPSEDRDRIRDRLDSVVDDGETVTVESALVTKSGESIPHELTGAPLAADGGVRGVIGTGRNVAGRRRRERTVTALHDATRDLVRAESEQDVATATADATEEILGFPLTAVRLYDAETDTLEPVAVTDAGLRVIGERPTYARGEGVPWRAFESGEPVVASADAVSYGTDEFERALYVPIGDHGTLSIVSMKADFTDADIGLSRVLAANAAAALDRLDRETQLRRYERMVNTAGDAIYALDTEGRFTAVNDSLVAATSHTREELIGEHVSRVLGATAIDHGGSLIRDLLSSAATTSETGEITVHTADGDTVPCEVQIALLSTDGEFEGTVGVVRDITARKRHEHLLESLHDATRGMMAAKTQTGVAETAVETIEQVLGMTLNGVWLADGDELRPAAISTVGRETFDSVPTYAAGDGLAWEAFEQREIRHYDRVDREPNAYNPDTQARTEVLVPLGDHGVLTIGSTDPGEFDESEVSLAKLVAANTEAALDRAARERKLRERERELTTLDRINVVIQAVIRGLVAAATREEIQSIICDRIAASELYEFAWITERDMDGELVVKTEAAEPVTTDGGIAAEPTERALETGEVEVRTDPPESWREDFSGSVAAVPLSYENTVYGVLVVSAARSDAFSARERSGFAALGEVAGFAINAARNMKLLLSDTGVAVSLRIRDDAAFPISLTTRFDCRYSLDGVVPATDDTVLQYATIEGIDPARVVELAGEFPGIEACRPISEHDEGGVFEFTTRTSPVNTAIAGGGTVTGLTAEDGEARLVCTVATETEVRAVVDALTRAHPGTELVSKRAVSLPLENHEDFRQSADEPLTEKQRAAVRAAYFAGYYDWPRGSTAEELAASMGVSSPTLHSHLRKAQRKLLTAFLGETE